MLQQLGDGWPLVGQLSAVSLDMLNERHAMSFQIDIRCLSKCISKNMVAAVIVVVVIVTSISVLVVIVAAVHGSSCSNDWVNAGEQ